MQGINRNTITVAILFITFFVFLYTNNMVEASENPSIVNVSKNIVKDSPNETDTTIYITNEHVTLEGLTNAVDFHIEIPHDYVTNDAKLTLSTKYSSLLQKGSSLTINVDGEKVVSKAIDPEKTSLDLEVNVPKKYLTKGFHTITVSFYGVVTEEICMNEDNPANWFTVLPNSSLQLKQKNMEERLNMLEHFPYPFIQANRAEPIQGTIVIPNEPSVSILEAAMKVANFLNNETVSEDNVTIVKEDEMKNVATHMIAIGSPNDWTGEMKNIVTEQSFSEEENELVLHNFVLQHQKQTKQLLSISAATNETIAEKIAIVSEKRFVDQLTDSSLTIKQLPTSQPDSLARTSTFKQLQIPNIHLTGKKQTTEYYFIRVPPTSYENGEASVQLFLNVAETLKIERDVTNYKNAELVVYVNDVPHSIAIHSLEKENKDGFYSVHIPIDSNILQQEPYVSLRFEANGLRDNDICVPPNEDHWIYVHEESFIMLPNDPVSREISFGDWPIPYTDHESFGQTAVLLPKHSEKTLVEQLYTLTSQLGKYGSLQQVKLYVDDGNLATELKETDVIIVGKLDQFPSIGEKKDNLLIRSLEDGSLDLSAYEFIQETVQHLAWQQRSPWNEEKLMTVFTSVQESNSFISDQLLDFIQTNLPRSPVVVESKNGEMFTQLSDDDLESGTEKITDRSEPDNGRQTTIQLDPYFLVTFSTILLISLFIFIYMVRRQRRNKE